MADTMQYHVWLTTVPDHEKATLLANVLLEKKACACVNIVPNITSMYWWDGSIRSTQEVLMILKSTQEQAQQIQTLLNDQHPYDVPELIALGVVDGLPDYLSWINSSTQRQ